MLLLGATEVFASHIVYKVPHNYQVVLRLRLSKADKVTYDQALQQYAEDQLVLVLDAMDMAQIDAATHVTGTLARDTADGARG